MREIKFRAWDKEKKKWARMNLDIWGEWQGAGMCQVSEEGEPDIFEHNSCDRFIWQQFTGLKDKNGKEIYEGDVIENGDYNGYDSEKIKKMSIDEKIQKGWIKIVDHFIAQDSEYAYITSGFLFPSGQLKRGNILENILVLGNIYENPNLLKKNGN